MENLEKEQRILALKENIMLLECGDDLLFSNGNGNKPRYDAMKRELKELTEIMK